MLYQLPNGKVIEISLNDFLDLTDEDIQYLISINYGEYIHSPWFRSSVKNNKNICIKEIDIRSFNICFKILFQILFC